jgi:long-chain-fatty-acid--CoA ligase ACSBG
MSDWNAYKFGAVGRPLLGSQTKVDTKTGELLISGRHICAGYMDMEDKTRDTIDRDGFLHTGDIGTVDEYHKEGMVNPSGFLRITGRLKEIIITAGGENIPPVIIEEQMKDAMPALSNCMVIGDKRKFLSMLCCLHVEIDDDDGLPTNKLSEKALYTSINIGSNAKTTDEAKICPKWKKYLDDGIRTANSKATSRAQQVAKWILLSSTFTEKSGELTPTLKLKRNVTMDIYSDIVENIYANT